jgi:uncharacterized membrane protein YcaP (DUF421 family)
MDELVAEARKQGIADMDEVYLATLEEDGTISFLKVYGSSGEEGQDPSDTSVV